MRVTLIDTADPTAKCVRFTPESIEDAALLTEVMVVSVLPPASQKAPICAPEERQILIEFRAPSKVAMA